MRHPQDKHLTHYCTVLSLRSPGLRHAPLSQNSPSEQWENPAHPRAPPTPAPPPPPPTHNPITNCTKCTEQRLGWRASHQIGCPKPRHKLRPWQWRRQDEPSGMCPDWVRVSEKSKRPPKPQSPAESSSQQDDCLGKADPGKNREPNTSEGPCIPAGTTLWRPQRPNTTMQTCSLNTWPGGPN